MKALLVFRGGVIGGVMLLVVGGVGVTGCSSKDEQAAKQLRSANADFAAGDYSKAHIQYLNVLRLQRTNALAVRNLGLIASERGISREAYVCLNEAKRLDPNDLLTRRTLGNLYFAGLNFAAARAEATFVLERQATNEDALVLLIDASPDARSLSEAKSLLERLKTNSPPTAGLKVAAGLVQMRERNLSAAEASFREALALDGNSSLAHMALGGLLGQQKRFNEADAEWKAASDLAPVRSGRLLRYAEFKFANGDDVGGRKILQDIIARAPDYLPGLLRNAEVAFVDRDLEGAQQLIQKALALDPSHAEALLMNSRVKLAKGDTVGALAEVEKAATLFPNSAPVQFELGKVLAYKGDLAKAMANLRKASALATNYLDPVLTLAQLSIRRGEPAQAIADLNSTARLWSNNPSAYLLLANAHRAVGDLAAAVAACRKAVILAPTNTEPLIQLGITLRRQTNLAGARAAYEQALRLNPDSLLAIQQMVAMDVAEKNYAAALQRTDAEALRRPKAVWPLELAADVHLAAKDYPKAEAELQKALALDPEALQPKIMLATVALLQGQKPQALERYQNILQKDTNNITALLQIALLETATSNYTAAAQAYEQILAVKPNTFVVLNNLADMYSERLGNIAKAEDLARKARQLAPADPAVADTLGWIQYRKGNYVQALALLTEGAAKLAEDPLVKYHLGMTHYMLGEEAPAKLALEDSLQLSPNFIGREEAVDRLTVLAINPTNVTAAQRADLESRLAARSDDPALLSRIAYSYQQEGAADKAAAAFERALARNPNSLPILMNLTRLHAGSLNQTAKALEYARKARVLAPDSAEIARTLGALALQSNEFKWARDLLEESSRVYQSDPNLWLDLALAQFSVGQVSESVSSIQKAMAISQNFSRVSEAKRLQTCVEIVLRPEKALASAAFIEEGLARSPKDHSLLAAAASLESQRGNHAAARDRWEALLRSLPDFSPAIRHLALLYFEQLPDPRRAYDLAVKARDRYPQDSAIARTLGILVYGRKEYSRAAELLAECAPAWPEDGPVNFYLGMSRYHLKQREQAKVDLSKALRLNLPANLSNECQNVLNSLK